MGDLALESDNTAEKQTNLIGTTTTGGFFVGDHILEVKPGTILLSRGQNVGGIFGRGVGGVGVHGLSSTGHGVRGEGDIGVFGISSVDGHAAVAGAHSGQGYGVVGDGAGQGVAGVLGRNNTGEGVRGESSATGFGAVAGRNTLGYGVVGGGAREL